MFNNNIADATVVPHVHAALIKQWADNPMLEIEVFYDGRWTTCRYLNWSYHLYYRIKPTKVTKKQARLALEAIYPGKLRGEGRAHIIWDYFHQDD